MGSFLIFNFDGTGNEPEDAKQEVKYKAKQEDDNISNVLKLHLMMGGNLFLSGEKYGQSDHDMIDHCFYYQGVGTNGSWVKRALNQGLALESCDVASILNKAKADFNKHYKHGDIILVTGFSRGAALARRFVGLIAKEHPQVTSNTKPFVFLCVFDTVASIGLPNLSTASRPDYDVVFEYGCTLSHIVKKAIHLVSLDDKRRAFQPTLMNYDPKRVHEIWFAGAHSDVGGGYYRDGLSDITLSHAMKWLEYMTRYQLGLAELPIRAMKGLRRVPSADWFTLCAVVDSDDDSARAVGQNGVYRVTKTGELQFFANDLKFKYGNNSGSLRVRIERVK